MKEQALRRQINVLSESMIVIALRVPEEWILKWCAATRRPKWAFVLRSFWITTEWIVIVCGGGGKLWK